MRMHVAAAAADAGCRDGAGTTRPQQLTGRALLNGTGQLAVKAGGEHLAARGWKAGGRPASVCDTPKTCGGRRPSDSWQAASGGCGPLLVLRSGLNTSPATPSSLPTF